MGGRVSQFKIKLSQAQVKDSNSLTSFIAKSNVGVQMCRLAFPDYRFLVLETGTEYQHSARFKQRTSG